MRSCPVNMLANCPPPQSTEIAPDRYIGLNVPLRAPAAIERGRAVDGWHSIVAVWEPLNDIELMTAEGMA